MKYFALLVAMLLAFSGCVAPEGELERKGSEIPLENISTYECPDGTIVADASGCHRETVMPPKEKEENATKEPEMELHGNATAIPEEIESDEIVYDEISLLDSMQALFEKAQAENNVLFREKAPVPLSQKRAYTKRTFLNYFEGMYGINIHCSGLTGRLVCDERVFPLNEVLVSVEMECNREFARTTCQLYLTPYERYDWRTSEKTQRFRIADAYAYNVDDQEGKMQYIMMHVRLAPDSEEIDMAGSALTVSAPYFNETASYNASTHNSESSARDSSREGAAFSAYYPGMKTFSLRSDRNALRKGDTIDIWYDVTDALAGNYKVGLIPEGGYIEAVSFKVQPGTRFAKGTLIKVYP